MSNKDNDIKWYESGNAITTLIIVTILLAIFCSQSFAVVGDSSLSIFTSIINHNALYLFSLVYFVLLKTRSGKRYFNYLNVFLAFFYFISTVTSILTLIQSFSLNTILGLFINVILFLYLLHTMFRDTSVWREAQLGKSPFNEIKNDNYYYALVVLVVVDLVVNLISTVVVSGLFISILDALYILLFGRYIYLYREYLDYHGLDSENEGNFDEIRENISKNVEEVKEKVNEVLDKTDIDEKIVDVANKVKDTVQDLLDKTDVDEKLVETAKNVKEKVEEKKEEKKKPVKKTTKKGESK